MQNEKPLTSEIIRRKCNRPDASLEGYSLLFDNFAREVEREFQSYHTTVVKCSNSGQVVKILTAEDQDEAPIVLTGVNGPLKLWISADNSIDNLLGEICLGGIGMRLGDQEEGRPPSKFEKNLRRTVFTAVALAFVRTTLGIRAMTFALTEPDLENETFVEKKLEKCVALNLLINAFTLSATITVHFRQEEFERCFSTVTEYPRGDGTTVEGVLKGTPFELNAYLAPAKIPLESILRIKLGSMLPLGVRVSTPVEIRCQGLIVSLASLTLREETVELVLLS